MEHLIHKDLQHFHLSGLNVIDQAIELSTGWNIMSFNNEPSDMMLLDIAQSLIDEGTLLKIQDETGFSIEEPWPGAGYFVDNIGDMALTEGYYIKVNNNTELSLIGEPVLLPFDISLNTGWNIMGYPLTSDQGGLNAVQSLIDEGTLLKIQDETGFSIEEPWPGAGYFVDNIGDLVPGEGYYIKVSSNTSLTLDDSRSNESSGRGKYAHSDGSPIW